MRRYLCILVFIFFQHFFYSLFKKVIMTLSHTCGEDFDLSNEFNIQGVIINYSFAHSVTIPFQMRWQLCGWLLLKKGRHRPGRYRPKEGNNEKADNPDKVINISYHNEEKSQHWNCKYLEFKLIKKKMGDFATKPPIRNWRINIKNHVQVVKMIIGMFSKHFKRTGRPRSKAVQLSDESVVKAPMAIK